ncbi:MAG: hypothetical protein IJK76_05265 [Bacteroidales bacterium]|nr:hypothetical protein [Bacteroidales bacterium]
MSIEQIERLHNEAMSIADDADMFKHRGQSKESLELFRKAFSLEREAAMAAIAFGVEDISSSVLVKSAAFLAYDGGLIRESEQMAGMALSKNLPEEIAEEMRDLLENIHFARHLRLNGVTLSDNEVQIVVAGRGVAHGMAREDDVNERISTLKQLAVRTAERSKGRKFRTSGQPSKDIKDLCTSYLSTSRAASFAVTLRIGEKIEDTLEKFQGGANALIEDIATNLYLVNNGEVEELKKRIKEQAYLENFVNLAKEFAPDGERVNLVGLTFRKDGHEVPVQLTTPRVKYRDVVSTISGEAIEERKKEEYFERVTLIGTLYNADSKSDLVKIQTGGRTIKVDVPEGLTEIVRKYFDTEVTLLVSHNKLDDSYRLISVDLKDDEPQLF